MKGSLENEHKILSATKNNMLEMITAQQIGALNKHALLTPIHPNITLNRLTKEGEDLCLRAKLKSNYKLTDGKEQNVDLFPGMSSFSMRFSSIEQASAENQSSIGPCIKRITFSSTAKKPEFRASAENQNETNHYILAGLSCEKGSVEDSKKKVNISEFSEGKEEETDMDVSKDKKQGKVKEKAKNDQLLEKKEKNCLCTIY